MSEPILPLDGDSRRQATGAAGGFVYQFWQAADAWLRLGAGDVLFLEHGEDFDVVGTGTAVGVQVKAEAGELSLGRKQARDAISQCWELRTRNADRDVSYRYLTTRARGFESGRPFGERTGLDVWDGARRSDEDLSALRAYLLGEALLPKEILALLETGSDAEVRRQIVEPLRWDTSAPDAGGVEQLVGERLVSYGMTRSQPVSAQASRRVSSAVFRRIATASTEGGVRRLTQADFAEQFDQETMESVPGGSAAAVVARFARTPAPPARAGDPGFLEALRGTRLPVVVERSEAVEAVRALVRSSPISAIIGSTGSGKTILAELASRSGDDWYRLDLRGLSPNAVARRVDEASLALADLPEGATVLLDDLAIGGGPDRIVTAMERLVTAARQQAIHIVATSATALPTRVALLSPQAGSETSLVAPMLTEAELGELARGYGCPPAAADGWARVFALKTSGHPQLAAAYAAAMRAGGWPAPGIEDIAGEPTPIATVRAEARVTLREALRDADGFDLVQRLSVLTHPFTRAQALRLAQAPPPLRMAALDLEALVGPWIEAVGEARYRLSPLLEGLYRETLPKGEHQRLRSDAADALVRDVMMSGSANAYDISSILFQGVLSGNGPAVAMGAGWAKQSNNLSHLADYLGWFTAVATGDARQALVPSSPGASLIARELQFRVALEMEQDVESVLAAWSAEIDALEAHGEPVAGHRALLSMSVLMNERARVSTGRLVDAARVALDLPPPSGDGIETVMDQAVEEHGSNDTGILRAMEASSREVAAIGMTPTFILQVLATRPATPEGVVAFLESALAAPAPVGPAAREAFEQDVSMTESVTSTLWTRAADAGTTDWSDLLRGFGALSEWAESHGLTALAVSAERSRAVILYEETGDRAAAEASLRAAEDRIGDIPRLREYRGKILRMEGEHAEALAFYEALMPVWQEEDPNTSRLYAYHDIIESAGVVGDWERAAFWATEAEARARRLGEMPGMKTGEVYVELCYALDGAFATYEAGHPCEAISRLVKIVSRLPAPTEPRLRMLTRRVTHVIGWIHGDVGGLKTRSLQKPAPGLASRFEPDPDEQTTLDITADDFQSILDESARLAGCETEATSAADDEGASVLSRSMRARRHLNDGIQRASPDLPDRWLETLRLAKEVTSGDRDTPDPPDETGTLTALTYGVVSAIAAGRPEADVLAPWSERLSVLFGASGTVAAWTAVASEAFAAAGGNRRAASRLTLVLRDAGADPNHRMVAAAALAKASMDPDVTLQAVGLLATSAAVHPFGMGVGAALASLSGNGGLPGKGVQEAARIVLGSERFGRIGLSPGMAEALRAIADDGPNWGMSPPAGPAE